jgi:tetratricopeptide (TPR) repeat protein
MIGPVLLLLAASPAATQPGEDQLALACRVAADAERPSRSQLALCDRRIALPGLSMPLRLAMLMNRGAARLKAGQISRALADFDLAIKAAPGLPEAWINKGVALSRVEGRAAEAVALISYGLEIGPKSPARAYFARAQAHEVAGNLRAAMEDFAAAARADPDWPAPAEELKRFKVERRKVLRG